MHVATVCGALLKRHSAEQEEDRPDMTRMSVLVFRGRFV